MTPQDLEILINNYKDMLAKQELTTAEYVELLRGIDIQQSINSDADSLAQQETLNTILQAAIQTGSMLA